MGRGARHLSFFVCTLFTIGCAEDRGIPPGCEDVFASGELTCSAESAVCEFVQAHPDRLLSWDVQFREDLQGTGEPSDKISNYEHKAECAERFLEGAEIDLLENSITREYFFVDATLAELEPLCRPSMIGHCGPSAGTEQCEPLSESDCEADPLCWQYRGSLLSPGSDCVEPDTFAICLPTVACTTAPAIFGRDDGSCFAFSSGCLPDGTSNWTMGGPCPDLEAFGQLPVCE
jgi:hypothetical protein